MALPLWFTTFLRSGLRMVRRTRNTLRMWKKRMADRGSDKPVVIVLSLDRLGPSHEVARQAWLKGYWVHVFSPTFPVLDAAHAHDWSRVDSRTDFDAALTRARELKPVAILLESKNLLLPMQNHLANALGLRSVGDKAVETSNSKISLRQSLDDVGVANVPWMPLEDVGPDTEFPFPGVVKPDLGTASKGVRFVTGLDDLKADGGDRIERALSDPSVGAQVLLLAAAPILSRLFEPSDFGVLALYVSVTSVIVSVATLRFDWLMPNARSDRAAAGLFVSGALVLVLVTLAVLLGVGLASGHVLPDRYSALQSFALLIPLGILGLGLHQLFQGWYVRRSDLLPVSKTKIVQSIGNIVISVALGFLAFGASGLLFGTLIASWLGISMLVGNAPDLLRHLRAIRPNQIVAVARRFLQQAVLSTLVSGLNVASSHAIILLLALVYAPAEVGLVAFAQRLMAAPVAVVAQALSQSFWAHASDLMQARDYAGLRRDYLKVSGLLVGLAVMLGVLALVAQPLIVPIFGAEWVALGAVLLALMPMIWGGAIVSPTNHLVVLNRQGLQLYADIIRLALVCTAIAAAAIFDWPFVWAVLAVACSSFLGHAVLFLIQLRVQAGLIRAQVARDGGIGR